MRISVCLTNDDVKKLNAGKTVYAGFDEPKECHNFCGIIISKENVADEHQIYRNAIIDDLAERIRKACLESLYHEIHMFKVLEIAHQMKEEQPEQEPQIVRSADEHCFSHEKRQRRHLQKGRDDEWQNKVEKSRLR